MLVLDVETIFIIGGGGVTISWNICRRKKIIYHFFVSYDDDYYYDNDDEDCVCVCVCVETNESKKIMSY